MSEFINLFERFKNDSEIIQRARYSDSSYYAIKEYSFASKKEADLFVWKKRISALIITLCFLPIEQFLLVFLWMLALIPALSGKKIPVRFKNEYGEIEVAWIDSMTEFAEYTFMPIREFLLKPFIKGANLSIIKFPFENILEYIELSQKIWRRFVVFCMMAMMITGIKIVSSNNDIKSNCLVYRSEKPVALITDKLIKEKYWECKE